MAFGEVGVYEPRGQYQLVVKALVEGGAQYFANDGLKRLAGVQ